MSFKLTSLVVENLVVFVDRTAINFSDTVVNNIEGQGKSNILQSNGTGKSLIIDAVSLALFGKGVRANYLSDYIAESNPTGGLYVGLTLTNETGTILKIERWRRPDSDLTKAKFWKDGVCVSKDATVSKIDEMVQSYIGVSHTNFMSCIFSVMVPGFLKLRPAQRFEILEQALAVKKIESVIKKINLSIRASEEKLTATTQSLSEYTNKLASETAKRDIYSANSDTLVVAIEEQSKELSGLLVDEATKSTTLSEYKEMLSACILKLKPLTEARNLLLTEIKSITATKQTLELRLTAVMKSFKQSSAGKSECFICKSSLTNESKDAVSVHYTEELSKLAVEINVKNLQLDKCNTQIAKLEAAQQNLEQAVNLASRQVNYIQTNILAVERSLAASKAALTLSTSSFNEALLKTLAKDVDGLSTLKKSLEEEVKVSVSWKQAMSKNGLRLAYIKEEVSTLSALASRFATAVYEKPMFVKFFINDEKDNPALDFRVNGKNAGLFSTGEGRRLEIAMTLSLMALLKSSGMNLGFLVLDEALDGLSESSKLSVLKVIDSLSTEYQIVMISHDPLIKQRPGNVIQICKDDTTNRSTVSMRVQK